MHWRAVVLSQEPAPHLSVGTWLRCFECAWLRVQSPPHTCMWSLHLTSQVGTGTRWSWAGIQCSFHSSRMFLERNKHYLKGYGCPKIPLESTSNYSSYGNPCGFVFNWHQGTFNSLLLKFIHIFSCGNTHRVAALKPMLRVLLPRSVRTQQHCLEISESTKMKSILVKPNLTIGDI